MNCEEGDAFSVSLMSGGCSNENILQQLFHIFEYLFYISPTIVRVYNTFTSRTFNAKIFCLRSFYVRI